MLKSINLSLSVSCGANCIYCHEHRGKRIQQKSMPFELIKKSLMKFFRKVLKKASGLKNAGRRKQQCFFNKDIIKILRYIKLKRLKIHDQHSRCCPICSTYSGT